MGEEVGIYLKTVCRGYVLLWDFLLPFKGKLEIGVGVCSKFNK